ncbi:molybdopterin biosynthesis protein B [Marinomonas sp. S3726]|uniref:molybdenum cofactor biosynthesis protein B n=1 Tax=Marinomonas sp. S3726 TaxID=579484 RepID=UPI0005FA7FDA|nr:molybdenum cofactor biosynthesis protein B [Marinomonas sp. S3726]KJZ09800.1 molybdopterin biosynthesis protein B [Marinomonas sp. S3726]
MGNHVSKEFVPLRIAVLTVSDTRTRQTDTSGKHLVEALQSAGHHYEDKIICKDDIYEIRAYLSAWISAAEVNVVLITGGTGFTSRDSTPEAITPLLDKTIDGFGELFRYLSYADIGTSTVQSRALAGLANNTLVVAMPGSTGACDLAWQGILKEQLDSRHGPCNFVPHLAADAKCCETRL